MGEIEIKGTFGRHLEKIQGARGINNPMGSYFTQRSENVCIVLSELKRRPIFVVDSGRTDKMGGFELACHMEVPAAERSVFLDNDLSPKAVQLQIILSPAQIRVTVD